MEITFLGTSAVQPTRDRNPTSILLTHGSENILIDCGEGTQRQLKIANLKITKITRIFISHWHGDHILGLPGLIHTLGASEYSKCLEIYGPKGTKKYMEYLLKFFLNKEKIKIKTIEIVKEGKFLETRDLEFYSVNLEHSCPTLGYIIKEKDKRKINLPYLKKFGLKEDPIIGKLQQGEDITYKGKKISAKKATKTIPGKKISILLDNTPTKKLIKPIENSDILIMEASFASELREKAKQYKHSTAEQAAEIAKGSKAKKLILTHIGKRYKSSAILVKEAKSIFPKTKAAEDFMKIKL